MSSSSKNRKYTSFFLNNRKLNNDMDDANDNKDDEDNEQKNV